MSGWTESAQQKTQQIHLPSQCCKLLGHIKYSVGIGEHIKLWQDPWHHMGVLIHSFPRGPQATGIPLHADLAMVIQNGDWNWPEILDIEHGEITHAFPPVTVMDELTWDSSTGQFTNKEAAYLFQPPDLR
ncbi:UNVERIFIED_CONTAM: hypothetical protein Slati_1675100 [Sesamum latifolium]|uniref:Uncharacterized protein n=1 Tax=Sesamum latifolium TaxID=2727402 RepID=A0AAW2WYP1_9LAMI